MHKRSYRPSGIKKTVSRLAASASIETVATPEPALTPGMAKAEDMDIAEENVIPLPIGLGPVADMGGDRHA